MDIISNIVCAMIGSGLTLAGIIYKEKFNAKRTMQEARNNAVNEYLAHAGRLVAFPAMNTKYKAALAKASNYFSDDQLSVIAEFEAAIKSHDTARANELLLKLTALEKENSSKK